MEKTLRNAMEDRRSYYAIGKGSILPEEKILDLVRRAVKFAPSAFNSQSARVVVLLGKEHDRLWSIAKETLRGIVPADKFAPTEKKIDSFGSGAGTLLYFEDQSTVEALQKQFPLYKDNFPLWSLQSSGMLQYAVWMLLEENGFGVSLQHYNPLIDDKVRNQWNLPANWKLLGEMPFGKPLAQPDAKTFLPLDERVRVFGNL